ncbi:MAG: AAA family ATPase, partial [Lachnospiraceae bacterium]|nr:AAA family ATPase [Lachnospiraceae bacterium]
LPDWKIGWEAFWETPLADYLEKMKQILQNPGWHAEGDVFTHTKMVCEALIKEKEFRELSEGKRQEVFLAALLHDIGKIPCTRWEADQWTSPGHTIAGAKMAREILWRDFGLSGTKEAQNIRECICSLIRYHSVPVHILDQKDPERRLFGIAAQGELIPDFSLSLLKLLVRADLNGRICDAKNTSLDTAALCFALAEENGILNAPGQFPSEVTKQAYLSGRQVWREQELYDDTWGEIILMSGLPGTGKDTWIHRHCGALPVISLDEIRQELRIPPTDNQGRVILEAREQAKDYLRKKQPFVWNATNLTSVIRGKQQKLFEEYHAHTRIIFLETGWERGLTQNSSREKKVPEKVIHKMLREMELPERQEARRVEWNIV